MVDSQVVLWGQTIAYTCYTIVIIAVMIWFGLNITKQAKSTRLSKSLFYTFVIFLTVLGVSLHLITYNTIPWAPMDMNRADIKADRTFNIEVKNHEFILPSDTLGIKAGETVMFDVTSADLTYGFGIFRQDNSMIFQMQVVPGHKNDILWKFDQPGTFTIRSTEYSGPKGAQMIVRDAVVVSE